MKFKKANIMFSNKSQSTRGIISVIFGGISLVMFVLLPILSSRSGGNGGMLLGGLGVCAFFMSVSGLILGIQSMKEEEIYYTLPVCGVALSSITLFLYLLLYGIGLIA